jgi:septal ring factor EnvC (AmiA/AmiB activator)
MQPAGLAQTAPEDVAATAAALSPELAQLLQSMARDLATVGQGIEQLKANQEQIARVIAKASEAKASETKASETKAAGQSLRPKISAPPPRPTATPTRKPAPTP